MKISSMFSSASVCHFPELKEGHKVKFIAKFLGLILLHTVTFGSVLVYHNIRYHPCSSSDKSMHTRCKRSAARALNKSHKEDHPDGFQSEVKKLSGELKALNLSISCFIKYLHGTGKDSNVVRYVIFTIPDADFTQVSANVKRELDKVNDKLENPDDLAKSDYSMQYYKDVKDILEKLTSMINARQGS